METVVDVRQKGEPGTVSDSTDTNVAAMTGVSTNVLATIRILIAISVLATVGFAILFWPLAFLPAIITVILYSILLGANMVIWRGRPNPELTESGAARTTGEESDVQEDAADRHWMEEERQREHADDVRTAEEKGMLMVTVPAILGLVIIAVVLASIFIGWRFVALGGMLIFCYLLLISGPIWLAAIEEKRESEHERCSGEKAEAIH